MVWQNLSSKNILTWYNGSLYLLCCKHLLDSVDLVLLFFDLKQEIPLIVSNGSDDCKDANKLN